MTQATLQEWALKNGLDADIQSMTQAEKAMLRYQYIMAQSSHITGDFARTSDTFHNTLTRLKANFMTLKGTIGTSLMNLFKPIMVVVNNAIVVINQFAKAVGDSLGKILGWRYEVGSGAVEMSDMADYADDTASGLGKAGKAAQDLKRQLQGFDELNNLTSNDDNGGGGGSGGGAGGLGGGAAGDLAGQWVKEESLFESDWDTWFKLGRGISEAWTKGLNSIDWDSVYHTFDNFGKGLADFLNGLITPDLFGAVGQTIAGSLNSALHFLNSFGTTFDWKNFGNSIATGINKFFSTFDFKLAAETINKWSEGLLDSALSAVEGVDWKEVGKSITDFVSSLKLGNIAKKLSKLAVSIAQGLGTALSSTDWTEVGRQIGEAINGLDLANIAFNLTNLAIQILGAIGKAIIGIGEENPLAAAIIGVILAIKFATKLQGIGNTILKALGLSVGNATNTTLGKALFDKINGLTTKYFGANTLTVAVSVIVAWKLGESLGKQLGNEIWSSITGEDMSEYFENFTWSQFFGEIYEGIKDNVLLEAWNNMWNDFIEHMLDMLEPVRSKVREFIRNMPFGEQLAGVLGIDIDYTKEELQSMISEMEQTLSDMEKQGISKDDYAYKFIKNTLDAKKQQLANDYGSFTYTSSSGVEHGGSSGKFGDSGFFENFKAKYQELADVWQGKDVDFTVDSNATPKEEVQKNYNVRSGFWGNLISAFSVNSEATKKEKVQSDYKARSGYWGNLVSDFTINSEKTDKDEVHNSWIQRSARWVAKKVNFTVDSEKTSTDDIEESHTKRSDIWTNKIADMTFSLYKTKIDTIRDARDARQKVWTDKISDFLVDPNKTSTDTIKGAYNSAADIWQDKTASFWISVGVSGQNVYDSIRNSFNNAMYNAEQKFRNSDSIFKNINLPRLAVGGVVDSATLAVIGENGSEAVVPLERNTQWLGKMANMLASEMEYQRYNPSSTSYSHTVNTPSYVASGNDNSAQIAEQNALLREQNRLLQTIAQKELTISEREVFNATRNASNNYYNRTGNSPFVF